VHLYGHELTRKGHTGFRRVRAPAHEGSQVAGSRITSGGSGTPGKGESRSVRRWSNQITKHGVAVGLKKAGRAGRRPRLSAAELEKLETLLREGPDKAGFPNGLWTLNRIAQVIRKQFQVKYRAGHVWWILRHKLGWSCQRPVGRARERNEAAIRDWQENIWPALKKKPRKRAVSPSL
jgi:transposase